MDEPLAASTYQQVGAWCKGCAYGALQQRGHRTRGMVEGALLA